MFYNSLLEKLVLPIGDYVVGSSVIKYLKIWRNICKLTENEIELISKENLFNLLKYTCENIPFYKPLAQFRSDDPYMWIKKFPIMKKDQLKENLGSLLAKPKERLIRKVSSGSSGIQSEIYINGKEQSLNRALQILWWEWAGWSIGTPIFQTGMTINRGLLKSMKDFLLRTRYYNAFGLSNEQITNALRKQVGKPYYYLGGYASSLYLMAKIAEKNQIAVEFNGAISWGDKMFPHFRDAIKKSFGCDVNDTYACSEGLMIAAQHDHEYYYIMSPHVFLEILDDKGNEVEDGELGFVVATRLDGLSMPLIRYYTGDLAVKLPRHKYPKNRKFGFPLMERIIGRDTDIVYTKSGKYLIVHFFTGIFEFYDEIIQFRIIQENFDGIIIEYIKANHFKKNVLDTISMKIHEKLQEPFGIEWREVITIPSTESGKPQIIKSFIGNKII